MTAPDTDFQKALGTFVTQFKNALPECSFGEVAGSPSKIAVYKPHTLATVDVPKTFKGYQVVIVTKR
jgi:hypothetical protein